MEKLLLDVFIGIILLNIIVGILAVRKYMKEEA